MHNARITTWTPMLRIELSGGGATEQDAREKAHREDAAASSDVRCASGVGCNSVVRSVSSSGQLKALRASSHSLGRFAPALDSVGRFAPALDSLGRFAPVPTK